MPGWPAPVLLRESASGAQTAARGQAGSSPVSYTHLRAHETVLDLVCRLLLEKKTEGKPKAKAAPWEYNDTPPRKRGEKLGL